MDEKIEWVDHSTVKLIQSNASDAMVAKAAWVSNVDVEKNSDYIEPWQSGGTRREAWDKRVTGLINFLYRERHMSPFEHGSLTFFVETPIFVAREFMRHRTFSYNETSGRYKELSPKFFLVDSERPLVQSGKVGAYRFGPGSDEQYGTVFAETTLANTRAWEAYQTMLEAGVAREVARNVLPVNIMTSFYVTGNPRNWMQFLSLRNDLNALAEIRAVAESIEHLFARAMPVTYKAYKKYDWRDERLELESLRAKVAQFEALETYADNIGWELAGSSFSTVSDF